MTPAQSSNSSHENSNSSAPNTDSTPTIGQLERTLSQKIGTLHREQLGHRPSKVTCQLLDTKLTIIVEESVTKPEKLLVEEGQGELAEQVREDLDQALEAQLKDLVQDVLKVKVIDCLSDSTLETERAGIIIILDKSPETRPSRKQ